MVIADHETALGDTASLEYVARPTPIYMIGDSHAFIFNDLLFKLEHPSRYIITKSRFIPTLTATDFLDADGGLNEALMQALFMDALVTVDRDPTHLQAAGSVRKYLLESSRARSVPIIVIFAGSIDLGAGFLRFLGDQYDIALPFDLKGVAQMPVDRPREMIPYRFAVDQVNTLLEPLMRGMQHLRAMGFSNLFLHCMPPPGVDDDPFMHFNGFVAPAFLRYKAYLLFNHVLRAYCEKIGVGFVDVWDDVTIDNVLDPQYELDGTHLNRKAALFTVRHVLDTVTRSERAPMLPIYQQLAQGAPQLAEPGAASFTIDRALLAPFDDLVFNQTLVNVAPRLDWTGIGLADASVTSAQLDEEHVAALRSALISGVGLRDVMGAFTVYSARALRIPAGTGIDALYTAAAPPGILRVLVLLGDVADPRIFALVRADGHVPVVGPEGTAVVFDPQRLRPAIGALEGFLRVLDLVVGPAPASGGAVRYAGMNLWPVNPLDVSEADCITIPLDNPV